MNSNKNLPLLQWVNGSWQSKPSLVSKLSSYSNNYKQKRKKTRDIEKLTQIRRYQLPRIGECFLFKSYVIVHQGRVDAPLPKGEWILKR
jgi:hypothetical protein